MDITLTLCTLFSLNLYCIIVYEKLDSALSFFEIDNLENNVRKNKKI